MQVPQTIFYLELLRTTQLPPLVPPSLKVSLRRVKVPCAAYNRFFYTTIGAAWHWIDRLSWTEADWNDYVHNPNRETWVAYTGGNPVGYFELEKQANRSVELVQLGVLPQFTRRGIGKYLLYHAVHRAWHLGAQRVWLHTCSHDDPAALDLYRQFGFQIFKQEVVIKEFPDEK